MPHRHHPYTLPFVDGTRVFGLNDEQHAEVDFWLCPLAPFCTLIGQGSLAGLEPS